MLRPGRTRRPARRRASARARTSPGAPPATRRRRPTRAARARRAARAAGAAIAPVEGHEPRRADRRAREDRDGTLASGAPPRGVAPPRRSGSARPTLRASAAARAAPCSSRARASASAPGSPSRRGTRRARRRPPRPRTAPSAAGRRPASSSARGPCPAAARSAGRACGAAAAGPGPCATMPRARPRGGSGSGGRRRRAPVGYVAAAVLGYLLGSIPVALLVARRHGVDLRRTGDGNPGAWNALEQLGGRARARPCSSATRPRACSPALAGLALAGWWGGFAGVAARDARPRVPAVRRLPRRQGGDDVRGRRRSRSRPLAARPLPRPLRAPSRLAALVQVGRPRGRLRVPRVQLATDPVEHVIGHGRADVPDRRCSSCSIGPPAPLRAADAAPTA